MQNELPPDLTDFEPVPQDKEVYPPLVEDILNKLKTERDHLDVITFDTVYTEPANLYPEQVQKMTKSLDSRVINFEKRKFKGIYKVTEKAYLLLIDGDRGMWLPKAMAYNMKIHSDNSVTIYIPDFCDAKECTIND